MIILNVYVWIKKMDFTWLQIHSIEEDEGEEEVTNGMLDEITSMIPKEHSTDLPFPRTTGKATK